MEQSTIDKITEKIIGCAIEVHRLLGPGLLESAYEECICYEAQRFGLKIQRQIEFPIVYKEIKMNYGYRLDLMVEDEVVVELKAVDALTMLHEAQLLTYLRFTGKKVGLLINFNVLRLKDGIRRLIR